VKRKNQKLLPIILGTAQSKGGAQNVSADKISPELKKKVFERDDYTCKCCGFQSKKYQNIHYLNSVIGDNQIKNMVTTCIFCHQCFYIDDIHTMRSGVLIWLPEISQADLHNIARALYVARISQGPIADSARHSLDILMSRREEMRNRLGTDDPYVLSVVLKDYITSQAYEVRNKKLEGVRLFPLDRRIIKESDLEFNQFPQILAYWRSKDGPFGGKVPKEWLKLYSNLMGKKASAA
jgi:intracellular multiplication protein IcmJ